MIDALRQALRQWRLERRRRKAVADIHNERLEFEEMVRRCEFVGAAHGNAAEDVRRRLETLEGQAAKATASELEGLVDEAEALGEERAYFCPVAEIETEGLFAIEVIEEWGVTVKGLHESILPKLRDSDLTVARGALRALYEEFDSWSRYVDDYNKTMQRSAWVLLVATAVLLLLGILTLSFPRTVVIGLLAAGAAGGCVSVIAKMPPLSLSGEFETYRRRILSRIGTGAVASLIGCALLGWGLLPIAIQKKTFADVVAACATPQGGSCTGLEILTLIGVPLLFGFTERALTSFEERILVNPVRP